MVGHFALRTRRTLTALHQTSYPAGERSDTILTLGQHNHRDPCHIFCNVAALLPVLWGFLITHPRHRASTTCLEPPTHYWPRRNCYSPRTRLSGTALIVTMLQMSRLDTPRQLLEGLLSAVSQFCPRGRKTSTRFASTTTRIRVVVALSRLCRGRVCLNTVFDTPSLAQVRDPSSLNLPLC
jgi:hypothetical protein